MGELTKVAKGGGIVGSRGGFLVVEGAEVDLCSFNGDLCHPAILCNKNTLETGFVSTLFGTIGEILRTGTNSEIFSAIVERVVIFVIHIFCPRNDRVHVDEAFFSYFPASTGVEAPTKRRPQSSPVPLHEPVIFAGVDKCLLAFGEGDKFGRLIGRLNNRLAVDAILGHNLTSNEIAVFGRGVILAGGRYFS